MWSSANRCNGGVGYSNFPNASRSRWSSADLGGVVGPVSGGESLPCDGDVGVDAEGAGQDRCGDLGGELEQGGAAVGTGSDAELVQSLDEVASADGPVGYLPRNSQSDGVSAPIVARS